MKARKLFTMLLCVVMALQILTGCQAEQTAPASKEETPTSAEDDNKIYFGVSAGLTGDAPLEGELMQKSVTLACEKINAAGGVLGKELVPVIEDDTYTSEGAIVVANKFVSDDRIVAIVGLGRSNCVTAIQEIVKEAGMPTLTTATSTSFYEFDNDYLFRLRATDAVFYSADVKWLVEHGAKKIGVIYETDDWGLSTFEATEKTLKELGVEYVASPVNSDVIDTSGQILEFRDAGCDAVVVNLHQTIGSIFSRQMLELGWKPELISGGTAFIIDAYYDLVTDEQADGFYVASDFDSSNEDPFIQEYVKDYEERWGETPDSIAAIHYNHVLILADAIERAGSTDRAAIAAALKETKDVMTTLGPMTCDERNDMVHTCNIFKNEGKTPKMVAANYS